MTETMGIGSAQAYIAETIKAHPVVLFMKGNPARPQCSFWAAVARTCLI
jgi:glutaredoxin-related protein